MSYFDSAPSLTRRAGTSSLTRALRVTTDGRLKMDPVFIRDGEEIVYTLLESPTQTSLMRLKLADRSIERLHPQATTSEFEATFTADGRYYAFVQNRGNLNLKLVIRDTKTGKDSAFDPGGGFAGMRRPSISPDASRVIFSIATATGQHITSVNMEGQDRKYLTQSSLNNWPMFSPDGKQIVFGSSRDGNFEIYTMNADGTNPRRLTHSPGLDMRPCWSPDGSHIAFTSNRDGRYQIYIMKADGTDVSRVSDNPERDDFAAWHPDGKRVVMVSECEGRFDLYVMETAV